MITKEHYKRLTAVEKKLYQLNHNPAPTVPQYDLNFSAIPPTPHGLLRADHWAIDVYSNSVLLFHIPDCYAFSQPDNGFVFTGDWLNVTALQSMYGGIIPTWLAFPTNYVWGPFFFGGDSWRFWIKNVYWDEVPTLLNNMQGSNVNPFTNFSGSFAINTFPGGGKAARPNSFDSSTYMDLEGDSSYQRNAIGTTYIAKYDLSPYQMGQGNIISNGMIFRAAQDWNPAQGASGLNTSNQLKVQLPLTDGADNNVWAWSLTSGFFKLSGGPGGNMTTGPAFSTSMSVGDQFFTTIEWDIIYNGHEYVDLPPGIRNPYTGI